MQPNTTTAQTDRKPWQSAQRGKARTLAELATASDKLAADRKAGLAISAEDFSTEMVERAKEMGDLISDGTRASKQMFTASFFSGALAAIDLVHNQIEGRKIILGWLDHIACTQSDGHYRNRSPDAFATALESLLRDVSDGKTSQASDKRAG